MNLVTRANWKQMEEEKKMCDALNELFAEELKEADSRGRAAGIQLGKSQGIQLTKKVFRLASHGESCESIAETAALPLTA